VTGLPYQQAISDLQAKLDAAIKECERCARPAHMVRNCPSASENETQAWRHRQSIEYQIRQLKNVEKTS